MLELSPLLQDSQGQFFKKAGEHTDMVRKDPGGLSRAWALASGVPPTDLTGEDKLGRDAGACHTVAVAVRQTEPGQDNVFKKLRTRV